MVVARIARDVFRVPIVIARLYDPARRPLYHNLDVQVVCTTLWGAEQMVSLITHPQWQVVGTLGNGEVQVVQIRVGRALAGRTVGFLSEDRALVVVGFTRGSQTCIAQPDQVLEQGDLVYLGLDVTANESVLHQLVGNGREVAA
jgi:trk system potassium uptake protein TrkA